MMRLCGIGKKLAIISALGVSCAVYALPTVDPVPENPWLNLSTVSSTTTEDRAAHLTLTQIETLKQEVSELRGLVEVQEHEIKQLKKSQQDLYLDLDKRLAQQAQGQTQSTAMKGAVNSNKSNLNTVKKIDTSPKTNTPISSVNIESKGTVEVIKLASQGTNSTAMAPNAEVIKLSAKRGVNATGMESKSSLNSTNSNEGTTSESKVSVAPLNPPKSSQPSSTVSESSEQGVYESAYRLVGNKQYPEAVLALQSYMNRFPQGEHIPNAHYWLGEVYVIQSQSENNPALLEKATQSFTVITSQFPAHPKATDALLKLGLVEADKGNLEVARRYLMDVKDRFPSTTAARIAEARLQQLN